MRRLVLLLLGLTLLTGGCFGAPTPGREDEPTPGELATQTLVSDTIQYYRDHRHGVLEDWWEVFALDRAGVDLSREEWSLPELAEPPPGAAATVYASKILTRLALGQDPHRGSDGRLFTEELAAQQGAEGDFGAGVNQTIWAIIALETAHGDYDRESALSYLVGQQFPTGGFSLMDDGGDTDVTAMALAALALLPRSQMGDESLAAGLQFLQAQKEGGGFSSYGHENANSLATAIWALVATGQDLGSPPWQGQAWLVALERFRLPDGSFSYVKDPLMTSPLSTAQSLLALMALDDGLCSFKLLQERGKAHVLVTTGVGPNTEEPAPVPDGETTTTEPEEPGEEGVSVAPDDLRITVQIEVLGQEETLFTGQVLLLPEQANVLAALEETGLLIETRSQDTYISQIGEETEDLSTGAGWKFRVNGEVPFLAAVNYELEDDDDILWWYASHPGCTGPE